MGSLLTLVVVIACLTAMGLGVVLVFRKITLADAIFEGLGTRVQGPAGIVLFLVGLVALVTVGGQHWDRIAAENAQLAGQIGGLKSEAEAANDQKIAAEAALHQANLDKQTLQAAKNQADADRDRANADLIDASAALETTRRQLAEKTREFDDAIEESRRLAVELESAKTGRREAVQRAADAFWLDHRKNLSAAQNAELDQVEKGVLALNAELTYLRLRVTPWPKIEGQSAVATYELHHKDFESDVTGPRGIGLFDFQSQRYRIKGDSEGRIPEALGADLANAVCEAMRRAIVEGVPLQKAVEIIPDLAKYDANPEFLKALGETTYIKLRVQMMAAQSLVLVRGYADGEQGAWEEPLDASRSRIQAHENIGPDIEPIDYALTFKPALSNIALGRAETNRTTYGNKDLPNLRAAEVGSILSALTGICGDMPGGATTGRIPVEILDGRVYPAHNEVDRKVRVFLFVFLKNH